ncbi:MAG TPA: hypothetical protein ENH82_12920 [bacterium]|nr:hypothetical protein [bacterium]
MIISDKVFGDIVNSVLLAIKSGSDDCNLHLNFFQDIVIDVCNFRKTLEDIVEMGHACDCPGIDGGPDCQCPVGVAKATLKEGE